jgi:phage shock protein A
LDPAPDQAKDDEGTENFGRSRAFKEKSMGILSRISKVLESNLNALIEKAEDPAKLLDQAIEDMKKGKQEAREAIIEAKSQKRLNESRRDKALLEAVDYEKKAMAALKLNNEDLARKCLELKIAAEHKAEAESSALAEQDAQIQQLDLAAKELDRRLTEMPAKRAALLARQATAQAKGARVGAANKAQNSVSSALDAFGRMEERVIRAEVEAEVVSGASPDMLALEASIANSATDDALAALKVKMAAQLSAGPTPSAAAASKPATGDAVEDSLAALKAKLR